MLGSWRNFCTADLERCLCCVSARESDESRDHFLQDSPVCIPFFGENILLRVS